MKKVKTPQIAPSLLYGGLQLSETDGAVAAHHLDLGVGHPVAVNAEAAHARHDHLHAVQQPRGPGALSQPSQRESHVRRRPVIGAIDDNIRDGDAGVSLFIPIDRRRVLAHKQLTDRQLHEAAEHTCRQVTAAVRQVAGVQATVDAVQLRGQRRIVVG